jgi:hypothetical protein
MHSLLLYHVPMTMSFRVPSFKLIGKIGEGGGWGK